VKILVYAPDLMDRSKIAAALPGARFVGAPVELAGEADLVIVDLSRPGALDALPAITARTIGFGSHVDTDLLDAARAAGCDEVLPRSRFFARLPELGG
jgi:hypothetical protein